MSSTCTSTSASRSPGTTTMPSASPITRSYGLTWAPPQLTGTSAATISRPAGGRVAVPRAKQATASSASSALSRARLSVTMPAPPWYWTAWAMFSP